MGLFNWTRKKKPEQIPQQTTPSSPPPASPLKRKLLQELLAEIKLITQQRNTRRMRWIQNIMKKNSSNIYKPTENEVIEYLTNLAQDLLQGDEITFFKKKYMNFQQSKKNLLMSNNSKQKINTSLHGLLLKSQKYQQNKVNNNTNTTRKIIPRTRFSSNASNQSTSSTTSISSLPSLQSLRNNTRNYEEELPIKPIRVPKRRLQGKVISPSKQSPTKE